MSISIGFIGFIGFCRFYRFLSVLSVCASRALRHPPRYVIIHAMKFLFASDNFKGSLTCRETAALLDRAAREVFPDCETDSVPVADGGEGSVEAVIDATGGEMIRRTVTGPLWEPVTKTSYPGHRALRFRGRGRGTHLRRRDRRASHERERADVAGRSHEQSGTALLRCRRKSLPYAARGNALTRSEPYLNAQRHPSTSALFVMMFKISRSVSFMPTFPI